jgi:sugar-phosphatase
VERVRAVVFDMDGVLIDSEPLWQEAEIAVMAAVGVVLDRKECVRTMGLRSDEFVAYWYARHPWRGRPLQEVERELLRNVTALVRERAVAKDGVRQALAFLAGCDVRLGLASSSPYALIATVLERLGLTETFACIHSAEEEPYGKPHPGVYLSAARKLGVGPGECVAIEDSLNGVVAAKAAKMTCVAIPDPAFAGDPRLALADVVLDSLGALDAAVWTRLTGGSPAR